MLADRVRMGRVKESSEVFYSIYFGRSSTVQIYDEVVGDWTLANNIQLSVPTIFRYKVHNLAMGVQVLVNDAYVHADYSVFSEDFKPNTEGNFDLSALATCIGMNIEDIVSIRFGGFLD